MTDLHAIFQPDVSDYLEEVAHRNLPDPFPEMHAEAEHRDFPIIGPQVGRFLKQVAMLHRPRRILEIGSGFGYSAIWWALGGGPEVRIDATEYSQELADLGRSFATKAGVAEQICYHVGDAFESIEQLAGEYDIVLIDCDKTLYLRAYDEAMNRLRKGGILLYDNMLWDGRLGLPPEEDDEDSAAIRTITDRAFADPRLETSLLSVRDGVLMGIKVAED